MCGVPWANRDYAGADAQVYELIIVTGGGTRSPHDLQSIPASAGPYNPHASGYPSVLINIMNVSYGATRPPSGCGRSTTVGYDGRDPPGETTHRTALRSPEQRRPRSRDTGQCFRVSYGREGVEQPGESPSAGRLALL